MAAITLLKRSARGFPASYIQGTDDATIDSIIRTTSGGASAWDESSTTSVTIAGASASSCTTATLFTNAAMTTINLGTAMGATDAINIGGSGSVTTIGGDLVVDGSTTTVDSEVVNIADNHLYLNNGYVTVAAQEGGLVINYLPTSTNTTSNTGGFSGATTVVTAGSGTFTAGDFIQISGSATVANDGVYEVLTHVTTTLTIDSTPVHSFAQTGFTTDTGDITAVIRQINVTVIQTKTDGDWEVGKGSTQAALTASLADITTGGDLTWANVLANGNTSGAVDPTITTGQSLLGAAELTMASTGATVVSLDTGGASTINIGGTNATDINIGAGGATVDIGTTSSGAITINSASTIAIGDGSAGAVTADSAAGISLDAVTTSNFSTSGSASTLTLAAAGGSTNQVIVNSAGTGLDAIDLNATVGGVTIDAVTGVSIDATNATAANFTLTNTTAATSTTMTITANNTGATSGDATISMNATSTNGSGLIDINADDAITVDSAAAGVSIGGVTDSDFTVNASGQSLSLVASGGGAQEVDITSAGTASTAIDLNATAGGVEIDGLTGVSIDATNATAANFTLTNTTAATSTTMTVAVSNTGATSGDSTLDITTSSSNGTATLNIGANAAAQSVNVGTGAAAMTVTLGSNNSTSTTVIDSGSGGMTLDADGTFAIDAEGNATFNAFDYTIVLDETQTAGGVGAGNPYSLTVGAGAASDAAAAGGVGGAIGWTAGIGGVGDAFPQDAGVGGTITLTAGIGGAAGANAGSNAGDGGDVTLLPGEAGATGSGVAGDPGRCLFTSGTTSYPLTAVGTGPALTTTAQTIIEAINEVDAASSSSSFVSSTWDTTAIDQVGAPVYVSGTDTASPGDADVEATSNIIGIATTDNASGAVTTHGIVSAAWEGGLTGGDYPVAGDPIFLSTTAGRVTTVAPVGAGDTVAELGYVRDPTGLTATTTVDGDLCEIMFDVGPRVLVG